MPAKRNAYARSSKTSRSSNVIARSVRKRLNARFRSPLFLVVVLAMALVGGYLLYKSFAAPPSQAAQAKFATDHILVRFRPGASTATQNHLLGRYGLSVKKEIPAIQTKVLTVNPRALEAVVAALSHNPAVDFAEKDWVANPAAFVPNDPWYTGAESQFNTQTQFTETRTNDAWDKTLGTPNTYIAVLDTGITPSHPDVGQIVSPWNSVDSNTSVTDTVGHGTGTTGIAAGRTNNGVGTASVCGGCSVMPIKISDLSSGSTVWSDVASGIIYAADHGAKVINISYGGSASSSALTSAEQYAFNKGLLIFASAGNSGCNCLTYPAADPGVIGVAAYSSGGNLQGYSDYGNWVQLAAPSQTYTTWPGATTPYLLFGGTSAASPFAAGIAGLLWSAQPSATASQVKQAILNNASPWTNTVTPLAHGLIDAYAAMSSITGSYTPTPTDITKPTGSITSPLSNATVSGQQVVHADASDNAAVSKVTLSIVQFTSTGNTTYGSFTDTVAPYDFYWDTTTLANGTYGLCIKVYDTSLNYYSPSCTNVKVSNSTSSDTTPPTATVSAPTNGSTVSSTVNVSATASDSVGVTETDILVDGVLRATSATGSVSFAWDTSAETNGTHTIVSKAYDAVGNVGTSSTVSVTVSNQVPTSDTQPPVVTIVSPAAGSSVAGQVSVQGSATDNVGVTKMELLIDGKLKTTSTTGSISYSWSVNKGVKSGTHTIIVNAYDAANNKATTTETIVK